MDITWLGHACVRIRTQRASVLMDPVDRSAGFDMGRPTADIATVSHDDPSHSNVRGIRGEPIVLEGPGEYEIRGVQIIGVATYLKPASDDTPPGRNITYIVEAEELQVAHLGGLGAPLTEEQAEQLNGMDVLIIPVGGDTVIDAEEAARIVRALEPAVVIPVHYPPAEQDGALQRFVQAVGVDPEEPVQRATFHRRGLGGQTTRLVLIEARGG